MISLIQTKHYELAIEKISSLQIFIVVKLHKRLLSELFYAWLDFQLFTSVWLHTRSFTIS